MSIIELDNINFSSYWDRFSITFYYQAPPINKGVVLLRYYGTIFFCLLFLLSGCNYETEIPSEKVSVQQQLIPDEMPKDFAFDLKYGVGAKNELNTFTETYTKDMVSNPPLTVQLKLTEEEMRKIYNEMRRIDIFADRNFKPIPSDTKCKQTPFGTYFLKVQANGETVELRWTDENCQGPKDQQDLTALIKFIQTRILDKKEQYRKIPTPKGGYA